MNSDTVSHPIMKAISAWLLFGVAHAVDIMQFLAAFAAFVYSCLLIYEWSHKRNKRKARDTQPGDL